MQHSVLIKAKILILKLILLLKSCFISLTLLNLNCHQFHHAMGSLGAIYYQKEIPY